MQDFLAGETLHGLARRHDLSRNLIRVWIEKYEAGALDEDARLPIRSKNTKPGSLRWSGWSADRLWRSSF